jgi:hypothetical protein
MNKEFVPYEEALALKELGFDEKCITKWDILYGKPKLYPSLGTLCFGSYEKESNGYDQKQVNEGGYYFTGYKNSVLDHENEIVSAPLYQQAFRWIRDKYNLKHELCSLQKNSWLITIIDTSSTTEHGVYNGKRWDCDDLDENIPHTYEEAELACLRKLIEIVIQNKDE